MLYGITNGQIELLLEYHPTPRYQPMIRGHGHFKKFRRFQPEVDAFKYAFLPRTIPAWNALPPEVVEADSLGLFKQHLHHPHRFQS